MSHNRRHPRFRLGAFSLNGRMTFASEVSILDIGLGGVSVRADKRLNIGGKYLLRLESDGLVAAVTCQVVWARLSGMKLSAVGESVAVYTAGMSFSDLSPDQSARLESFVDAIGDTATRDSGDRRTHARHPRRPPEIALVDFAADYTVRTISLSGMLIECTEPAVPESRIPMVLGLRDGTRIEFCGRIVSCQLAQTDAAQRFQVGIEFLELSDEGLAALASFIEELASSAEGSTPVPRAD